MPGWNRSRRKPIFAGRRYAVGRNSRTGRAGSLINSAARREKPVAVQHTLGLRRGLPKTLNSLAQPLSRFVSAGVLGKNDPDPEHNACWLIRAAKR